ncbi:MAG: tail fiber domain-containing protein, partial [Flavobacteriales bacterium]|nr:tail fiber domain-containing protein [Flavobacteriales bacterium]
WSSIEWHSTSIPFPWQLRTEVNTGNGFLDLGSQYFQSVPYAELARGNWSMNGNDAPYTSFIGTTNYAPLSFKSNNQTRMTIDPFGSVGIGTETPHHKLDVHHTGGYGLRIKSLDSYSALDIDGYLNDAALRFSHNGDLQWNIRNYNNSLQVYEFGQYQRLLIEDGTGRVAIGTGNPHSTLHVDFGTDASLVTDDSGYLILGLVSGSNMIMDNNEIMVRNNGNESELYLNAEGGAVVINSAIGSTTHSLYCNGTAAKPGGGSWTATSDARLKENVLPFTQGLQEVLKLEPVTYHYITNTGHDTSAVHVGVIAQELQKICPAMVDACEMELLDGTKGEYLSVDPSAFTYMLINAIQEQQKQIDELEKRIELIESKR